MPDGHVYCEKCGHEIQFVPVFEPEVEDSIQHTLNGMLSQPKEDADREQAVPEEKAPGKERAAKGKAGPGEFRVKKRWLLLAAVLTVFCIVLAVSIKVVADNSYDYQMGTADKYVELEEYEQALPHMERAYSLGRDEEAGDARLKLAALYVKLGDTERAEELLYEAILARPEDMSAYKKLIQLLEQRGAFEDIQALLLESGREDVQEQFKSYIASPPSFSLEAGEYDEVMSLKLMSDRSGDIYYTINGGEPTIHDEIYREPILLTDGVYEIAAIFVNENGIASEAVEQVYRIEVPLMEAPAVTPKGGIYNNPVMIAVSEIEGCDIYYTTDGSEPDEEAELYVEPLPMPLGKSTFRFAAVTEYGVASEVAERTYTLNMPTLVDAQTALNSVKLRLMAKGKLLDADGHSPGRSGLYRFECVSAVNAGSRNYYLIDEYFVSDPTRNEKGVKSVKSYAVDVATGEVFEAVRKDTGQYEFSLLY